MKQKHVMVVLGAFLIGLSVYLQCSKISNNNPIDPKYNGNYRLHIQQEDFSNDTLNIFQRYALVCSTGDDPFASYRFAPAFDTILLIDSLIIKRAPNVDTVYFYCFRPFNGEVILYGIRPNKNIDSANVVIRVANRYRIENKNKAVVGEPDSFIVSCDNPKKQTTELVWVRWSVRPGAGEFARPIDTPFVLIPSANQAPRCTVNAVLMNNGGRSFTLKGLQVSVIQAIYPVIDSVAIIGAAKLGESLSMIIMLGGTDKSAFKAFIAFNKWIGRWRDSTSLLTFAAIDTIQFSLPAGDTGEVQCTVYTKNSAGLESNRKIISTRIEHTPPEISFGADSATISLGDTSFVNVKDVSTAEKFIWRFDSAPPETTVNANFQLVLTDTNAHSMTAQGIDRFGYAGNIVSIVVRAGLFDYSWQLLTFPDEVKAKSKVLFIAGVKEREKAIREHAVFLWTVSPPNYSYIDTMGTMDDTLALMWSDSAHVVIKLSITDSKLNGKYPSLNKTVTVKRFAPYCAFNADEYFIKTTDSFMCTVSVGDSNSDGSIDSIFWARGGKNPKTFATRDSALMVISTIPDTFWITAYARDNDGFESNRDSVYFIVKAFRPYIDPPMNDITVFMNSPIKFVAHGHVSDSAAKIVQYDWDFDGNGSWEESSLSSDKEHSFPEVGTFYAAVKCRDNKSMESIPDTFIVTVNKGEPVVDSISPTSAWLGDSVTYTVHAKVIKPLDSIVGYHVSWNNSSIFDSYGASVFSHAFADSGRHIVQLYVTNKDGLVSDTILDTIFVDPAKPVVDSLALDTSLSNIFVNDVRTATVFSHVPHGSIDSCFVLWADGFTMLAKADDVFSHAYAVSGAGQQVIKARVRNDKGIWSDTLKKYVTVRLGKPVVDGMLPETIWVNDDTAFTVSAHDTNGTIDSIMINWGDGADTLRVKSGTQIKHKYDISKSGVRTMKVFCRDDDGIFSAIKSFSINVKLGKPRILSIIPDKNIDSIFIKDTIGFTINYSDSNGSIESISIDNGTGTFGPYQLVTSDAQYTFNRIFALSDTGLKVIRAKVKDNDGLESEAMSYTFKVRVGRPKMTSARCERDTIWVLDINRYRVSVRDTNGYIRNIYANWEGGSTPQEMLAVNGNRIAIDTFFTHAYDTMGGHKTARFWAMDDDSVLSAVRDTGFTVRKGTPVLWGDAKDTLWAVIDNGTGFNKYYSVHVNHFDTNGTIAKYYWNSSNTITGATITTTDTIMSVFTSMTPFNLYIFCRDDDSLLSSTGGPFLVFPDSAPPKPEIVDAGGSGSPVNIAWSGKDAKDGNKTLYAVMAKKGSTPGIGDTLVSFKAGNTYDNGSVYGKDYKYTFTPTAGSGTYYYRVIAKDARGTMTESDDGTFFY